MSDCRCRRIRSRGLRQEAPGARKDVSGTCGPKALASRNLCPCRGNRSRYRMSVLTNRTFALNEEAETS